MSYSSFINSKSKIEKSSGFKAKFIPDFLFDFQKLIVDWAISSGRAGAFEDCGLGKTIQQLVWAENVVRSTNRPVLILTPLAVSHQTAREGKKFGIECERCANGKIGKAKIVITNYQRLHYFSPSDFAGVVCDESAILKDFSAETRIEITDFMLRVKYRSLWTATPSPNDYVELGNSSEALGVMRRVEMLSHYFVHDASETQTWRIKGHAEQMFWRWICSWARAIRKPSDYGFQDDGFKLPKIHVEQHVVKADKKSDDFLFDMPAVTLEEQRDERRRTIRQRCEKVAELVSDKATAVVWCHLNEESNLLKQIIPNASEVCGSDSDDHKERVLNDFSLGNVPVLVTKPSIAGWGMNFQVCSHQTFFPSHSFEQWYQCVRRSWRFGQKKPVKIDVVTSAGESRVLENLQRKEKAAEKLFDMLVYYMNDELCNKKHESHTEKEQIPSWL